MSLYERVYDPAGALFEVPSERAADLVLNKGWTKTPVVTQPEGVEEVAKPAPEPEHHEPEAPQPEPEHHPEPAPEPEHHEPEAPQPAYPQAPKP